MTRLTFSSRLRTIGALSYLEPQRRSEGGGVLLRQVPILLGEVRGLPPSLLGLILTSDLQGRSPDGALPALSLLHELPDLLAAHRLPPIATCGVVLAGDLYGERDQRSVHGDVQEVWQERAMASRWVVGSAGNHDTLGDPSVRFEHFRSAFNTNTGGHVLAGDAVVRDGLCISGVSGVIGRAGRYLRHDEADYHGALEVSIRHGADILVVHEWPFAAPESHRETALHHAMVDAETSAVVFGHRQWPEAVYEAEHGPAMISTDKRVLVFVPPGECTG